MDGESGGQCGGFEGDGWAAWSGRLDSARNGAFMFMSFFMTVASAVPATSAAQLGGLWCNLVGLLAPLEGFLNLDRETGNATCKPSGARLALASSHFVRPLRRGGLSQRGCWGLPSGASLECGAPREDVKRGLFCSPSDKRMTKACRVRCAGVSDAGSPEHEAGDRSGEANKRKGGADARSGLGGAQIPEAPDGLDTDAGAWLGDPAWEAPLSREGAAASWTSSNTELPPPADRAASSRAGASGAGTGPGGYAVDGSSAGTPSSGSSRPTGSDKSQGTDAPHGKPRVRDGPVQVVKPEPPSLLPKRAAKRRQQKLTEGPIKGLDYPAELLKKKAEELARKRIAGGETFRGWDPVTRGKKMQAIGSMWWDGSGGGWGRGDWPGWNWGGGGGGGSGWWWAQVVISLVTITFVTFMLISFIQLGMLPGMKPQEGKRSKKKRKKKREEEKSSSDTWAPA
eukprot:evm.model.scf_847EXC.1 EVM.evm.TU.scf_847EXC.1   scf_847EXC:205-2444(+)